MPALVIRGDRGDKPASYHCSWSHRRAGIDRSSDPVQSDRGSLLSIDQGLRVLITIHPSALLHLQDEDEKRSGYARFVNALRSIERLVDITRETDSSIRAAK
jgi:hypothetical protein